METTDLLVMVDLLPLLLCQLFMVFMLILKETFISQIPETIVFELSILLVLYPHLLELVHQPFQEMVDPLLVHLLFTLLILKEILLVPSMLLISMTVGSDILLMELLQL
jgi:hypothetical protein